MTTKHGESHKGDRRQSAEYRSWIGMKERCYNERHKDFAHYGGRGIVVCKEWRSDFARFLADVGRRPDSGYTIDRIDVDGNYEPGNVRWISRAEQSRNRRCVRLDATKAAAIRVLVSNGFARADIAEWFGVQVNQVHKVVRNVSWPVESRGRSGAG